jgi:hypothetical protein
MKVIALGLSLALAVAQAQDRRQAANPLDHLPANVEMLTHFGERADISPDNQRVAFMAKSFGDAMVIDLATRTIRCLTCNVPAAVFLRVMHLVSGDYILVGPDHFEDIRTSRTRDNELWYLSKAPGSKPVKFHEKMSEGVAISKSAMTIAYSQIHAQVPEIPEGASRLIVATVKIADGAATIENRRTVYESRDEHCTLEAQDFFDHDTKMTATCYEPGGLASVMVLDLATGAMTNMSKAPGTYNEVEGIFPGGQYTCVEGDRQVAELGGTHGSGNIDIWKLKLDGTGRDFVRLTHFNDYEGGKASNPVVSTDGRFLAFQAARTSDPAGVGYGILLYRLDR